MGRRQSGNGSGGALRAKTINSKVPLVSGLLTTVSSFGLLAPVTFARTGGNANLTLASNGQISATAALSAGATQSIMGTATGADGVVLPFTANLTGQPTLGTLALSSTAANTATSATINIIGSVLGSTISGNVPPGMTLSSVNRTISGTPTAPGTYEFDLIETLAGAFGSPKASRVTLTVTVVPSMEIGIGLQGLGTYSGYYAFSNLMWVASKWIRATGTGAFTQSRGVLTPTVSTDTFFAYLSDNGKNLPTGTYTVINPDGCAIGFGGYSNTAYTGGFKTDTQFTFNYNGTFPGAGLYICARGPVTNINGPIRVIMPGYLEKWNSGNVWTDEFLNFQALAKPRVFRFMDWVRAFQDISENASEHTSFNDISFTSDIYTVSGFSGGTKIPYELCADLCNRIGADMWMNIPVRYTDACADAAFTKIANTLNADRKVYVEYGNETWNIGNAYVTAGTWISYINHTRYEAVPNGSGGWLKAGHGLTTGQQVVTFSAVDYMDTEYASTASWVISTGQALYVNVIDANNFTTFRDAARTQQAVSVAEHTKMIYKIVGEAGKTADLNGNHGARSLQIWNRADAILGRSRVKHVMGTRLNDAGYTTARLAPTGAKAATDFVSPAYYYFGEWWIGCIDIASGQFTPKVWSYNGSGTSARNFRAAIYAAGSNPTLAEVMSGSGAGYIAHRDLTRNIGDANAAYTTGTAFAGLTNGTSYVVRFVFTDGDGLQWMASGTATCSATASTVAFDDGFAAQQARTRRKMKYWQAFLPAQQVAAQGIPLAAYEIGPDFFVLGAPVEVKNWLSAWTDSAENISAFKSLYRTLASSGFALANQFNDVSGLRGAFGMADSLAGTTDPRFLYFSGQNGLVPKGGDPIAISNVTAGQIPTQPAFPYNVATLGPAGYTYAIINGDVNGGNFAVAGNQLQMVNASGINWTQPAVRRIWISADDGNTQDVFSVQFTTGNSWFENDALYAWDSTLDTDNAAVNPQIGGASPKIVGAGATISGGLWKLAGDTYYTINTAMLSALNTGSPFLIAAAFDIDNTPVGRTFLQISGGTTSFRYVLPSTGLAGVPGVQVLNAAASVDTVRRFAAAALTGVNVYWIYCDGSTMRFGANQTENTSQALAAAFSGNTSSRDVCIGGNFAASSQAKHGSIQIVSRTGLTLAEAKAMVAKMQTLHGIT